MVDFRRYRFGVESAQERFVSHFALKAYALVIANLCLTACVTRRDFVVAPETVGVVT